MGGERTRERSVGGGLGARRWLARVYSILLNSGVIYIYIYTHIYIYIVFVMYLYI